MIKVLLVEDDQFIGDITSERLAQAGFAVTMAATGAAALEQLENNQPQVVLLDLDLPDMSGVDILRRVKTDMTEVSVIIFSNNDNPDVRAEVEALGAKDFFVKATADFDELTACIKLLAGVTD